MTTVQLFEIGGKNVTKELDAAKQVLALDEDEQISQAFKAMYFPVVKYTKERLRILPAKEYKQEEKRKDVNVKSGIIALTNKRFFWLERRGTLKKTYHPTLFIYLKDIVSMNMQGRLHKRMNVTSREGEFQFRFGGMEQFIDKVSILQKSLKAETIPQSNGTSTPLEELKKLKELLDMGAITPEEYEEKKKKILERV
jgi:hypothetical protein